MEMDLGKIRNFDLVTQGRASLTDTHFQEDERSIVYGRVPWCGPVVAYNGVGWMMEPFYDNKKQPRGV